MFLTGDNIFDIILVFENDLGVTFFSDIFVIRRANTFTAHKDAKITHCERSLTSASFSSYNCP